MNMKKFYHLAICAIVCLTFSSCFFGGGGSGTETPTFSLSDLQGYWQENGTEHYVRFTTERSEEYPYYLGYEWNDDEWSDPEMTYEEFLIWNRNDLGHPGNGWFKYELKTSGTLTEIHLMDNGGAENPKVYVVSRLTDDELVYYEKEHSSIKYHFSKIVSPK